MEKMYCLIIFSTFQSRLEIKNLWGILQNVCYHKFKNLKRTCTHKITNLPIQVNISDNLYFLWNCHNMHTLLILDKLKYLIYSLRVRERVKCGHSILRCKNT